MKLAGFVVALVCLGGGVASAEPPARLLALLDAIDVTPPDQAALERVTPRVREELVVIAEDPEMSVWRRQRALSFLSFYPDSRTVALLERFTDDPDEGIAGWAAYTLGRSLGATLDPAGVARLETLALGARDEVAAHAVRALRWVDADGARVALTRIAREGRPEVVKLATWTKERRAARLKAGRSR